MTNAQLFFLIPEKGKNVKSLTVLVLLCCILFTSSASASTRDHTTTILGITLNQALAMPKCTPPRIASAPCWEDGDWVEEGRKYIRLSEDVDFLGSFNPWVHISNGIV